ncbi:hypothetical protein YC2023_040305 [Brassica napus]
MEYLKRKEKTNNCAISGSKPGNGGLSHSQTLHNTKPIGDINGPLVDLASSNQLLVAESLVGGTDLGIHRACTYSRCPQQPHNPLHLRRRRRTNPNFPSCCSDSLLTASLSQQCPSRQRFPQPQPSDLCISALVPARRHR